MNADFLEEFLRLSDAEQQQIIDQRRKLDQLITERDAVEQKHSESLEQRWLRVPKWRRAIILAAEWVQFKFTPKWL